RGTHQAVGCDVRYKKGIEGYVRKKRTYEQQKDIEEIQNKVRQDDIPSSVQMRFNLSSTTSMGEGHMCYYNSISDWRWYLHFKKLLKGHMKVSVIKVVEIYKIMELPMPDDEIPNLESAVKGFIQCPIAAIACFTVLYLLYLPLGVII
nr:ulp1 protease family, C-terminal catalytic domain-containing protein [Tanacetum cinerariifolium]